MGYESVGVSRSATASPGRDERGGLGGPARGPHVQNTKLALDATQRVYLIEKGVIRHEGTCADLKQDPEIRPRYLGV